MQGMKITANKAEILARLKVNREKHSKIVAEAREGYVKDAKEALKRRLKQLNEGKITSLVFSLHVPEDHTKEYDLAIEMLELSQTPVVELTSDQVQCLVQDRWGWKRSFLCANSGYSVSARNEVEGSEEDD